MARHRAGAPAARGGRRGPGSQVRTRHSWNRRGHCGHQDPRLRFSVRPEGSLAPGQRDYFETLTLLVRAYDDEHFRDETEGLRGADMLKYLMEQTGMRTADLGRLLGNRGLASLTLNGHRELSKAH